MGPFVAGLTQQGDLPIFYRDKDGKSINMKAVFGIDKTSPYGTIQNVANSFTMTSISLSVQYQQTFYVADEYGTQGYIGSHSDYAYVFNPGNPVVDCADFKISLQQPVGH